MPLRKSAINFLTRNVFAPIFSPHRLTTYEICPRKYFYQYFWLKKIPDAYPFPEMVFGLHLHKAMEIKQFYRPLDYKVKKRRGRPKKDSADEFSEALIGKWKYAVVMDKKKGGFGPVRWRDKDEPYARWVPLLQQLGPEIYKFLAAEEPTGYSEYTLPELFLDGERLGGRVDRMMKPWIIRDYKSKAHETLEFEMENSVQFTTYGTVFNFMGLSENEGYREFVRSLGVSDDDFGSLADDPLHILKKVRFQHVWLPTGYVPKDKKREIKIIEAIGRKPTHVRQLEDRCISVHDGLLSGKFTMTDGDHCNRCVFIDQCRRDSKNDVLTYAPQYYDLFKKPVRPRVERTPGQLQFDFDKPKENSVKKDLSEIQLELFKINR